MFSFIVSSLPQPTYMDASILYPSHLILNICRDSYVDASLESYSKS